MAKYWIFLFAGILCEILGIMGMRALVFSHPMSSQASATIGIVISYFCVSRAVEKIPMGLAYAIWSGLGKVCLVVYDVDEETEVRSIRDTGWKHLISQIKKLLEDLNQLTNDNKNVNPEFSMTLIQDGAQIKGRVRL